MVESRYATTRGAILTFALIVLAVPVALAQPALCTDETARPQPLVNDIFRRMHVSACWVETDSWEDYDMQSLALNNSSGGLGARRRDVFCPIVGDDLLSRAEEAPYTQVLLTALDFVDFPEPEKEAVLVASHCEQSPSTFLTLCDVPVWTGSSFFGSTGPLMSDLGCKAQFRGGRYLLNVPVSYTTGHEEWHSFVGVSLAAHSDTRIVGYEVSRCSDECDEYPESEDWWWFSGE